MTRLQLAGISLVAVVFAVGLGYASVEVPFLASSWLGQAVDMPGYDSGPQFERAEAFVVSHHLRPIGLGCLSAIVLMMATGLVMERRAPALVGAVAIFLPVFGHFAASMFFLAGLGLLRILWLPVLDLSYRAMSLGEVVFVPYAAVVWLAATAGVDVRGPIAWLAMTGGALVFVAGTMAWFVARVRARSVADFWVYRISRHPQYLGWIVWSYGLMLHVGRHSELYQFKISWGLGSSLPWMVSTFVILGVAMLEEVHMRREVGDRYEIYRSRTPFLFPLPRSLAVIASAPMRWTLGHDEPASGREVVIVVGLYIGITVLLSLPLVVTGWPASSGWWGFPYNVWPFG